MSYYLPLNKATLLFFPPQSDKMINTGPLSMPWVVQVMIKQARTEPIDEIAVFFRAQNEITSAIESVLVTDILAPLPSNEVKLAGRGYSLHGVRKCWKYGKGIELAWGETPIRTCDDKWVFNFALNDDNSSSRLEVH
ncbi:hypothetical protein BDZ94DRAFT_1247888 [Collybia nuda]|uniref:Uncharacterized protein n=1 Tax=Collybia nuda TaxID=64659 RepID=A0A9P5YD51_9AGAR|nr:hypothetical protein BDZ94DRAFT_1247888 [Collybia nuda]